MLKSHTHCRIVLLSSKILHSSYQSVVQFKKKTAFEGNMKNIQLNLYVSALSPMTTSLNEEAVWRSMVANG